MNGAKTLRQNKVWFRSQVWTIHTMHRTPAPEQSDRLLEEILQSKTHAGSTHDVQSGIPSEDSLVNTPDKHRDPPGADSGQVRAVVSGVSGQEEGDRESTPEEQRPSSSSIVEARSSTEQSMATSMESSFYRGSSNISRRSSVDASPPPSDTEGRIMCQGSQRLCCGSLPFFILSCQSRKTIFRRKSQPVS